MEWKKQADCYNLRTLHPSSPSSYDYTKKLEATESNHYDIHQMDDFPLATAYVPLQSWKSTYEPEKALHTGTIFPELDKPFCEGRCPRL